MKKVLAAVLAGTMVASMGAAAFADSIEINGFLAGHDLGDDLGADSVNLGTYYVQDDNDFSIDLLAKCFINNPNYGYQENTNSGVRGYAVIDQRAILRDMGASSIVTVSDIDDLAASLKKASPTALIDIPTTTSIDDWANYKNGAYITTVDDDDYSGYIYLYNANGAIAYQDNYTPNIVDRNLTAAEIRDNKITAVANIKAGTSKAIANIELDRQNGEIDVEYVDRLVSTGSVDYEAEILLAFDGDKDYDNSVIIYGTLENRVIDVYDEDDYVDISDGTVADPQEFNESVALYVGEGVTVHTKLFKDKKYYCVADRVADEEDYAVMVEYPEVDNVLKLYRVGVNNVNDYVTLSTDYAGYYVYDEDMNYLGRGSETLDFSETYYLAGVEITDVAGETQEPVVDEEPVEEQIPNAGNPTTGGDDVAANNVNANPGTGR